MRVYIKKLEVGCTHIVSIQKPTSCVKYMKEYRQAKGYMNNCCKGSLNIRTQNWNNLFNLPTQLKNEARIYKRSVNWWRYPLDNCLNYVQSLSTTINNSMKRYSESSMPQDFFYVRVHAYCFTSFTRRGWLPMPHSKTEFKLYDIWTDIRLSKIVEVLDVWSM